MSHHSFRIISRRKRIPDGEVGSAVNRSWDIRRRNLSGVLTSHIPIFPRGHVISARIFCWHCSCHWIRNSSDQFDIRLKAGNTKMLSLASTPSLDVTGINMQLKVNKLRLRRGWKQVFVDHQRSTQLGVGIRLYMELFHNGDCSGGGRGCKCWWQQTLDMEVSTIPHLDSSYFSIRLWLKWSEPTVSVSIQPLGAVAEGEPSVDPRALAAAWLGVEY